MDRLDAEFKNRKDKAWGVFHKHKKMLLNRDISLRDRLKFFDACITPIILFALAAFPITQTKYQELDRIQRKMLRRIVGIRRIVDEPWEDIMRKMKDRMREAERLYHSKSWSERCIRNKWKLASHIVRSDKETWAKKMITFQANAIDDEEAPCVPHRYPGRPQTRWDDKLRTFCRDHFPQYGHWSMVIQENDSEALEEQFIQYCIS